MSPPAVAEAVQRLRRAGYVRVGRGKRLALTPKGRRIAEVMARRRRLLEQWLTCTLGLDQTEAYREAHRLEHALSPRVEQRLAMTLGVAGAGRAGQPGG